MSNHIKKSDLEKTCAKKFHEVFFLKQPSIFFKRLVEAIKNTYFQAPPPNLNGRMQELSSYANKIIDQLKSLDELLKSKIDKELYAYAVKAINTIVKNIMQLQAKSKTQKTNIQEVEVANKKFEVWNCKAKVWLELCDKPLEDSLVIQTLGKHFFLQMKELIEQDITIINNYKESALTNLALTAKEKENVKENIENKIAKSIEKLRKLNLQPDVKDLNAIANWKAKNYLLRNLLFNRALQDIDTLIKVKS